MSEDIRVAKWHPVFGKDLEIGLEANIPIDAEFDCDSNLVTEKMILLVPKLQPVKRKVHCPAVIGTNESQKTIRFLPCFTATKKDKDGKDIESNEVYFRIGLHKKTGKIQISLARFPGESGEEKNSFGFRNSGNPYQYLDFLSKRKNEFTPLFVRIKNMQDGETTFLVIQTGDISEDFVEILIKQISSTEVPPTLLADK